MLTKNIFKEEERAILLSVDKAKASSNNSQVIGRNGELPFIVFLNNYLPPTLKAVSGHFVIPSGDQSPQVDCMILDARFPLLGYNSDNSVLAMGHSVLWIIELKTNATKRDIQSTTKAFAKIGTLLRDIWKDADYEWKIPKLELLSYRIATSLDSITYACFEFCNPSLDYFDIRILRYDDLKESGVLIHFEPLLGSEPFDGEIIKDDHSLIEMYNEVPLSDMYYDLIQGAYNLLHAREYTYRSIGKIIGNYLSRSF